MANIFDYQQKNQLISRFLQYTSQFKVIATSTGNNKLSVTINNETFTVNRLPTYQVESKSKLAR